MSRCVPLCEQVMLNDVIIIIRDWFDGISHNVSLPVSLPVTMEACDSLADDWLAQR